MTAGETVDRWEGGLEGVTITRKLNHVFSPHSKIRVVQVGVKKNGKTDRGGYGGESANERKIRVGNLNNIADRAYLPFFPFFLICEYTTTNSF